VDRPAIHAGGVPAYGQRLARAAYTREGMCSAQRLRATRSAWHPESAKRWPENGDAAVRRQYADELVADWATSSADGNLVSGRLRDEARRGDPKPSTQSLAAFTLGHAVGRAGYYS